MLATSYCTYVSSTVPFLIALQLEQSIRHRLRLARRSRGDKEVVEVQCALVVAPPHERIRSERLRRFHCAHQAEAALRRAHVFDKVHQPSTRRRDVEKTPPSSRRKQLAEQREQQRGGFFLVAGVTRGRDAHGCERAGGSEQRWRAAASARASARSRGREREGVRATHTRSAPTTRSKCSDVLPLSTPAPSARSGCAQSRERTLTSAPAPRLPSAASVSSFTSTLCRMLSSVRVFRSVMTSGGSALFVAAAPPPPAPPPPRRARAPPCAAQQRRCREDRSPRRAR